MRKITVYDYAEDFDNADLPEYERDEQLREAIREYNEAYETWYDVNNTLRNYKSMRREKQWGDR
jgi:cell fate (sporulation/competence/biofilm development) regulator YlbF (YheA/YmcA/DUF963 family)